MMSISGIVQLRPRKVVFFFITVLLTGLAFAPPLKASESTTQILGLVATANPVELKCANGICAAQFSSFCLQRERPSPGFNASYAPTREQDLTLVLTAHDGSVREIPAAGLVQINTLRSYAAVKISLAQSALADLGAKSVALSVADQVSLLPATGAGEIKQATGQGRAIAAGYFDRHSGEAGVARVLSHVINTLHPQERLSSANRKHRWQTALKNMGKPADIESTAIAEDHFNGCQNWLDRKLVYGLRNCLEGRHDMVLRDLNMKFWKSLKPGS
jgi:hypothetical protein